MDKNPLQEQPRIKRQYIFRQLLRIFGHLLALLLTRTTIKGRENIPTEGPILFAANHFSTYDAVMMFIYLPKQVQLVGPGDFKLLWPANVIVENIGLILTDRGAIDKRSLKAMTDVLKGNGFLALFPEGGTWEKRLEDVKSGAAYLSNATNATIVPIAIGGTYQVWSKMLRLKRPKVTMTFGKPVPPIHVSENRKTRQQELQDASVELMRNIYQMLPPQDQALYDLAACQQFSATIDFMPATLTIENLPKLSGLTEVVSKPNLFSPLHKNAKLPLDPFTKRLGQFTPAAEFEQAIHSLQNAFADNFKGYLEYRLGEEKANEVYQDLVALLNIVHEAAKAGVAMRFTPQVNLTE